MAEPAQKKAKTERVFLFSSESVNKGHPDKLCDQVSDAVLDTCLASDPKSKVACETATKDNMVMVAGEITTQAKIDYDIVVRGVVAKIGFESYVDDLSSVDTQRCEARRAAGGRQGALWQVSARRRLIGLPIRRACRNLTRSLANWRPPARDK